MSTSSHNPFVGPRSIRQDERLYGRDREVRELHYKLQAHRVVVLHSPSGAGKSSLIQAGLIPRLRAGDYDVWNPIRVNLDPRDLEGVPPGTNRYLLSAMMSLEAELPAGRRRTAAQLAGLDFETYLSTRPRRKARADCAVVLLFDQFEEILTLEPWAVAQKQAFFTAVGRALDTPQRWALFVVRDDYLAALAPYRDRLPTQLANTFRLDLLGIEAAKQIAVQLARLGVPPREFPGVERLVHDLSQIQAQRPDGSFVAEQGVAVEPVQLQVVCRRLWERLPEDDLTIEAEDIERYARVSTALGDYYAAAVKEAAGGNSAVERRIRAWVDRRLIAGKVRQQVLREAGSTGGLDNAFVDGLERSYVVRREQRAGASWCELSHDRLVEPVLEDNAAWEKANLHPLLVQARLWESKGRGSALLASQEALDRGAAWIAQNRGELNPGEIEFLDESAALRRHEANRRRTQRLLLLGFVASTIVMAALGAAALYSLNRAKAALNRARDAMWMSYARTFLDKDPTRAILGLGEIRDPDRIAGWLQATVEKLQQRPAQAILRGHQGSVLFAAWSPDGRRIVTAAYDGTARIFAADGSGQALRLAGHAGPVRSATWSLDGARIVTASEDGTARIWDAVAGRPEAELRHPERAALLFARFSPDGEQVVTRAFGDTWSLWDARGQGAPVDLGAASAVAFAATGGGIVATVENDAARVWSRDARQAPISLRVLSERSSPDGRRVVIVTEHGPVRVLPAKWAGQTAVAGDRRAGALADSAGVGVLEASFSADGSRIMAQCRDGEREWMADGSGKLVRFTPANHDVDRDGDAISDIADEALPFSRGPVFPPSPGWETLWNGNLQGRSLGRGGEHHLLGSAAEPGAAASFSPDGRQVLTVQGGRARIWSRDGEGAPLTLACETTPLGRPGSALQVRAAVWSADGRWVKTLAVDKDFLEKEVETIYRWSAETGELAANPKPEADESRRPWLRPTPVAWWTLERTASLAGSTVQVSLEGATTELRGHEDEVFWAAWSPDGQRLVTASRDRTARVWGMGPKPFPGEILKHDTRVKWASFSPGGQRLATIADGRAAESPSPEVGESAVTIWDTGGEGPPRPLRTINAGHYGLSVSFNPAGTHLATGGYGWEALLWESQGARPAVPLKIDDGSGPPRCERIGSTERQCYVLWALHSPDGRRVAASFWDNSRHRLRVVRVDGTEPPIDLPGHRQIVRAAAWSSDGGRLVTASQDHTARVFSLPGGASIELNGHREAVRAAAFSPDGRQVVTAADDKTARIWTLASTPTAIELKGHEDKVFAASFSPDGRQVLTLSDDGTARLWDLAGNCRKILEADKDLIYWAAWSPDGARVVTALRSGRVELWNAAEGAGGRVTLSAHTGAVTWAQWSPDGKRLVTTSDDRTARLWTLESAQLLRRLQSATSACVTDEERVQYLGDLPLQACAAFTACEVGHGRPPPVCAR